MQALANKTNGRVKAFASANRAATRVRAVQCRAQQQQVSNVQQVAAAVLAAAAVCAPAAHAATEVLQSGMDMGLAAGSGAAVVGLGALLVAADPQKRWVAAVGAAAHMFVHRTAHKAVAYSSSKRLNAVCTPIRCCWSLHCSLIECTACPNLRTSGQSRAACSLPANVGSTAHWPLCADVLAAGVSSRWHQQMAMSWRR